MQDAAKDSTFADLKFFVLDAVAHIFKEGSMFQRGLVLLAMLLATLSFGTVTFAADADMQAVLARLKALEDKNKALEEKNKELEGRVHSMGGAHDKAVDRAMMKSERQMASVLTAPDPQSRPLKIGGYLDVSYEYNFTRPDNFRNNNRIFDRDSNGFAPHLVELNFERLPVCEGQAGFRIDLDYGTDPAIFQATEASGTPPVKYFDIQQGYIEYIAPIGNGITIDVGKFVTWSGFEVIESSDNINASRSFNFGLAIPFTHTGVRATYPVFKDKWTVGLGVVNGWDNAQDNNNAKTAIFLSNWQVNSWWNWTITGTLGDESFVNEQARLAGATAGATLTSDAGDFEGTFDDFTAPGIASTLTGKVFDSHDSSPRALFDTTMTFTPWEKWTFVANANYAQEGSLPNGFSARRNRDWYGITGYAKYQFLKNWYVAGRYEYFNDQDGARTGLRQALQSATATVDWCLADPMHIRFEYRHDDSNVESFSDSKGVGNGGVNFVRPFRSDTQDTVMMQFLYKF
jgi:hypothetical protein